LLKINKIFTKGFLAACTDEDADYAGNDEGQLVERYLACQTYQTKRADQDEDRRAYKTEQAVDAHGDVQIHGREHQKSGYQLDGTG